MQGRVNSSKFVKQVGATPLTHPSPHATLLQNRAFPRQPENWPRLSDKATHLRAQLAEVGHPFRPSSRFSKAYRKLSYRGIWPDMERITALSAALQLLAGPI